MWKHKTSSKADFVSIVRTNAFYRKSLWIWSLLVHKKTEKKSNRHCYNNFQQIWDFKSNKIRLCRQRQMLNLFPKSQLHYPGRCISWRTPLPYGSCRHLVPQGNGLLSLNHPIWGHIRLCPCHKHPTRTKWLISKSNTWLSADIHPGPLSPGSCESL